MKYQDRIKQYPASDTMIVLTEQALLIAQKWVKIALGDYYKVNYIWIDTESRTINGSANPISSGFNPSFSIPLKYMDDIKELENDALAWKKAEDDKRAGPSRRKTELEAVPEVKEYIQLTQSTMSPLYRYGAWY